MSTSLALSSDAGVPDDVFTLASLVVACEGAKRWHEALAFVEEFQQVWGTAQQSRAQRSTVRSARRFSQLTPLTCMFW